MSALPAIADHARWSDLHLAGCQAQARNSNKEAEEKFRLALLEATQSHLKEERAATLFTLACLEFDEERIAKAEKDFREALQLKKELFGANHIEVARVLRTFARLLRFQNHPVEAKAADNEADKIEAHFYPNSIATMDSSNNIVVTFTIREGKTTGDGEVVYPPEHPNYEKILKQVNGLKPGEHKRVPPFPDP